MNEMNMDVDSSQNTSFLMDLDFIKKLFFITLTMISIIGLIMVFSSSYIYAKEHFGSSTFFFYKQLIFYVVGLSLALFVGRTKFSFWIKYAEVVNYFAVFLLILTFIPGIGNNAKGANRWISFAGFGFQPSELLRYTIIIFSLKYFESFERMNTEERIKSSISLILPLLLLIKQPDFGALSICFIIMGFVCFLSSFSRKKFYTLIVSGVLIGIPILFMESYRVKRLFAYLDPWKNSQTSGFQIIQSYLAFAKGSFFGQGIGNSLEKLFYLPEAHNDFIFSVLGEEMGFIGTFFVIMLFISFCYLGFKISLLLKQKESAIIVSSIIFAISLQAFLNMGVVLGLLPTKGLNLPFISYGGSSLISNFFAIGIIISALRQNAKFESELNNMRAFGNF